MNLRSLAVPFLLSFAGFAACSGPEDGAPTPPESRSVQGFTEKCPTRTVIWENPGRDGCPKPKDTNNDGGVWTGETTFFADGSSPYCKYTWNKPDLEPDFDELRDQLNPDHVPSLEPERDCPVVGVHASADPAPSGVLAVWEPLRKSFWQLAGRSEGPLAPLKYGNKVRVAVLDTSQLEYEDMSLPPYGDADEHGRLVGRVIGDLSCPEATKEGLGLGCATEIKNYPALARKDDQSVPNWFSGPPEGGHYGTLTELAEAIERALADWNIARTQKDGPPRLVINLSVGWSPVYEPPASGSPTGEINPATLPLHARPVYTALARAACAGAVVVAAAGNRDLSTGFGMIYPAAWERAPAPSYGNCIEKYPLRAPRGTKPAQLPIFPSGNAFAYRPLVYAAGALDALDQRAGVTRKGGVPRLAAYGVGVVTTEPRTGGVTRIKSGTSLSTAVTSAAVGLAWAYKPELRPDEIMKIVYESGTEVAPATELEPPICAGQSCSGPVRRVSVCAAAARVRCDTGDCGDTGPSCKTLPAGAADLPSPLVDWAGEGFHVEPISTPGTCPGGPGSCNWGGDTSSAEPWVGPQPGSGGCDTCVYGNSDGAVSMALDIYARKCAYAMRVAVETTYDTTEVYTVTPPVAASAVGTLSTTAAPGPPPGPAPPPFETGIFKLPLPIDPYKVRSVSVWFHTDDGEHPGGAYTRAENIPIVR